MTAGPPPTGTATEPPYVAVPEPGPSGCTTDMTAIVPDSSPPISTPGRAGSLVTRTWSNAAPGGTRSATAADSWANRCSSAAVPAAARLDAAAR